LLSDPKHLVIKVIFTTLIEMASLKKKKRSGFSLGIIQVSALGMSHMMFRGLSGMRGAEYLYWQKSALGRKKAAWMLFQAGLIHALRSSSINKSKVFLASSSSHSPQWV